MPLSTDKIRKVAASGSRAIVTGLATDKSAGALTCELALGTGWVDGALSAVDFIIYRKDPATGLPDSSTQTDWVALRSGTTITNMRLVAGVEPTDGYPADSNTVVMCTPTAAWANELIEAILAHANPDGSLKSAAVQTALGISGGVGDGWDILNAGVAPTVVSGYNKGNKEFDLKYSNVNLTSVLTPGMRHKISRTGTVPTQCTDLESSSSQYWSKTTPTGLSFTDDFTCEGWVKLESYTLTAIVSRFIPATGGFALFINANGQVQIYGEGAASANRSATSYQSIPLNQWVHVAASLDMSANSGKIYINGVDVAVAMSGAAVALVQAGNLQAGAYNGGGFFDGEIFDPRVWSTVRTAAQIRDNMSTHFTAPQAGLVFGVNFNGNATDYSGNANNLTASGGAVATVTDNPFKAIEYGIITKVSYSAPDTVVTVFAGTDYTIPNATLATPYYSRDKVPFGFPAEQHRWQVVLYAKADISTTGTTTSTWFGIGSAGQLANISIPIGSWNLGYQLMSYVAAAASNYMACYATLTPTSGTDVDPDFGTFGQANTNSTTENYAYLNKSKPIAVTVQTPYYINLKSAMATISSMQVKGTNSPTQVIAKCAYL